MNTKRRTPLRLQLGLDSGLMRSAILIGLLAFAAPAHAQTFNGYQCTEDCSGHEAGCTWAEDNDIDDEDDCSTASSSFDEGCRSFVEEQEEEQSEETTEEE